MSIINNALSGSLAAQLALDATSQNVSNMKTPGYTRQGVVLAALGSDGRIGSAGSGVEVSSLMRFSDNYKTQQMWRAATNLGQHTLMQPYFTQLEQIMGDDQSSISKGLDTFFQALNAASVEPTSTPLRQQVITAAGAMAQNFNSLNSVLSNQRQSIQQQRSAVVPQINQLTSDIALLNQKIALANATGISASSLIDARDHAIDQLAGMVGIQVIDQPDGARNVSLPSGQPLVLGSSSSTMTLEGNPDGSQTVKLVFGNETFTCDDTKLGGQLGGLGEYETKYLLPLKKSLGEMAEQLSDMVNAQLTMAGAAFKMDGTAGVPLFIYSPSSNSGILTVDSSVGAADLAFSADGTPGNSDNLQALIYIRTQPISLASLGSVLLGDADTQLVGKLGMDSKQNQSKVSVAETVRMQAEQNWNSTSGVNADEEAISLVEYQKMYQANMKVISVANTLFDATLAMMG